MNFKRCLRPGGVLLIDHRNYDDAIDTGYTSPKSIYYNVSIMKWFESFDHFTKNETSYRSNIETILLYTEQSYDRHQNNSDVHQWKTYSCHFGLLFRYFILRQEWLCEWRKYKVFMFWLFLGILLTLLPSICGWTNETVGLILVYSRWTNHLCNFQMFQLTIFKNWLTLWIVLFCTSCIR